MKRIKLHYYMVDHSQGAQPLDTTLQALHALDLGARLKQCGTQQVRLEDVEHRQPAGEQSYWLMRFSKFRDDHWPGVAGAAEVAKDLDLAEDQFLAEDTFALYSPSQSRFVVQYNHFGVRTAKIKEYFNNSTPNPGDNYRLLPVLTSEAEGKFQSKQIVTSVDATIEGLTEADIALFNGSGLEDALRKSVQSKATKVQFTFSVDGRVKNSKLERGWITSLVDAVKFRAGDGDKLLVSAKANAEDAVEMIDLLEARKFTEYNADSIERTAGRRYVPEQMFALLTQANREWVQVNG